MVNGFRKNFKKSLAVFLTAAIALPVVPGEVSNTLRVKAQDNLADSQSDAKTRATSSGPLQDSTYDYNFASGSGFDNLTSYTSTAKIDTLSSTDGFLTLNGNGQMYWHDAKHGLVVEDGNSIEVEVAGNAYITVQLCEYSKSGTVAVSGGAIGSTISPAQVSSVGSSDGEEVTFAYSGDASTLELVFNNSGTTYLHGISVQNTSASVDTKIWAQKDFAISVNGYDILVTGAGAEDASAQIQADKTMVYFSQSEKAYISLDLGGATLSNKIITNNTPDTVDSVEVNSNGDIVVNFKDQTTYPASYTIKVQDTSQFETPKATSVYSFALNAGAIPTEFTASNPIQDYYMTDNGILTIGAGAGTRQPYFHDTTHGAALYNENYMDVKVAGDAEITFSLCAYGNGGTLTVSNLAANGQGSFSGSNDIKGTACNDTITYVYTGDATTLRFTLANTGEAYLHGVTVKNTGVVAGSGVANIQSKMPAEVDDNDTLSIIPTGHRLNFNHSDASASITTLNGVGYYLFDAETDFYTIEADVKISSVGATNSNGTLFGIFENGTPISKAATIGLRGDGTVRNLYTKTSGSSLGVGGINTKFSLNETIHVKVTKTSNGIDAEVASETGEGTYTVKYSNMNSYFNKDTEVCFGFAFANTSGIISNLVYTDADGNVLYDQNSCYDAVGDAPVASAVDPLVISDDRTSVTVTWSGENCEDDGSYVVELSTDGGNTFSTLSTAVTTRQYVFDVTGDGAYVVRVSGLCGANTSPAVVSDILLIQAPLESPTIGADSFDRAITLTWNAVNDAETYCIYRKSTEENDYTMIMETADLSYTDADVVNETPYYYYVIAKSSNNESNPSNVILTLPSAGHAGEYEYGDQAANIVITKKSYDTVYQNKAVLEGIVNKSGTMELSVNGIVQQQVALDAKGTFSFMAALEEGRNDVNLYFTDEKGYVTRKTYNFVYLTNYDLIVDGSYTGVDGAESNDVKGVYVYSTVQAAVDSVSSNNTERVIILVKEGTYTEHLAVASPYITLIGEDRDMVNISFYDAIESPAGGDTDKRCAVYVKSSATGFSAENLTFENTYQYLGDGSISNESADALRVDADQSSFVNVKLLGYQDTLDASSNNQYYYKCYIAGNVDYIYGSAQALFDDCELVFRYNANKNSGYITAPKTAADKDYGYIFNNCRIYAESGCNGSKYLLARPWGPDGAATFINCYMSGIINAVQPYADMSGNLATEARFQEFYTYGAGFKINNNRPQISEAQAAEMLSVSFLGWNPYTVSAQISEVDYKGSVVTKEEEKFVETEYEDDTFDPSVTDDTGLGNYGLTGYASSKEVTGGGYLLETSEHYYKVATAEEFLSALVSAKKNGKASVIELTADIALGSIEIGNALTTYSAVIKENSMQPLLHPTLLKTGVTTLSLKEMSNLTIFSQNGAKITHTCIDINGSSNIIIRNIVFDELWEWDEDTSGDYDRNDWDYMTIQNGSTGIWIDHCTFYKAYDGVIDVKKAVSDDTTDVTISWCSFFPESEGSFFDDMMDLLEANPKNYDYYNTLLTEHGMTKEQVRGYASFQKKTHLVGASDTEDNMQNLRVTLANNYYKNSMDRMPRLRAGSAHVFNCILDAADIYALKNSLTDEYAIKKIVSNGAISTCGASVLLENCNINSIINALLSGNAASAGGYINAVDSVYYMGGVQTELTVTDYAGTGMILDRDTFVDSLPYDDYILLDAESLKETVLPYAGAGNVTMTAMQWQKTQYNAEPVTDIPGDDDNTPDDDEEITTPDDDQITAPGNGGVTGGSNSGNSQTGSSSSTEDVVTPAKAETLSKEELTKIDSLLEKDANNDSAVSVKVSGGVKGNIEVTVDVSANENLKAGDKVYVYYYHEKTGKLYSIYGGYGYKVGNDGTIQMTLASEGIYVVLENQPSSSMMKSLPAQTWASINYSVLYLDGEVGRERQVEIHLPDCLEIVGKMTDDTSGAAVAPVTVTYSSSDQNVASVSEDGVITAEGIGTATITIQVTFTSGKVKTIKKKVTVKDPFIRIKAVKEEMKTGETYTITAQGYGVPTKELEYEVGDNSILTIDEKGTVKALKKGTTTVAVTYNGVRTEQKITVK